MSSEIPSETSLRELSHHRAVFNGIELHWVEAGAGSPVVLLHGFPEFWYCWRKQVPALVAAGHRVMAVDLPGYNLSAKPSGAASYAVRTLVNDVTSFLESVGVPVALVGHDWGGLISWEIARSRPDLLRRLVILNVPHPRAIKRSLRSVRQLWRYWYQLAMRPPLLPEAILRWGEFAVLRSLMKRAALSHPLTAEELDSYIEAWGQPGALRSMVNYYRALFARRATRSAGRGAIPSSLPAMMIWGERDPVFLRSTAAASQEAVPQLRIEWIAAAGHFTPWDAPERVNSLLVEFLA